MMLATTIMFVSGFHLLVLALAAVAFICAAAMSIPNVRGNAFLALALGMLFFVLNFLVR